MNFSQPERNTISVFTCFGTWTNSAGRGGWCCPSQVPRTCLN